MNLLIGYGYSAITTGRYYEECFRKDHQVVFVGSSGSSRPGYPPDLNLPALLHGLDFKPDLFLYVDSGENPYLPRGIEQLPCPTAAYLIDVHLEGVLRRPMARLFDYVFIAQRDYLPQYQTDPGQWAGWLPLAADLSLYPAPPPEKQYEAGFVGRVDQVYARRARLLHALSQRCRMNDYRRFYNREETAQIYSRSKIIFNSAIRDDLNMRIFEALASGSLLLTDRIGNGLLDLFEDGRHLVTYRDESELLDRAAYYLEHESERLAIAQAGRAEIERRHTYAHRAERILQVVFQEAPGASSPMRRASDSEVLALYSQLYSRLRLLDASFGLLGAALQKKTGRLPVALQFGAAVLRSLKHAR